MWKQSSAADRRKADRRVTTGRTDGQTDGRLGVTRGQVGRQRDTHTHSATSSHHSCYVESVAAIKQHQPSHSCSHNARGIAKNNHHTFHVRYHIDFFTYSVIFFIGSFNLHLSVFIFSFRSIFHVHFHFR